VARLCPQALGRFNSPYIPLGHWPFLCNVMADGQLLVLIIRIATARTAQKTSLPLLRVPGKTTCPQSCSLATAVMLSPVYTAVT
jgi:hypothetical protein